MDVYKIAVEIALVGGLAEGLSLAAGRLMGMEDQVNRINKGFGSWGTTLAALTLVGGGIYVVTKALEDIFKNTSKLSAELTKVKQLGAGPDEMAGLQTASENVTRRVPGTTLTGIAETYREIRSLFGPGDEGAAEARSVLEPLSRLAQTMGGFSGNYEKSQADLRSMLKSADILGYLTDPKTSKVDPKRLVEFLNVANQAYIGTGGMVDPQTWLGMAKQGGISMRGLDPNGLMQMAMFAQIMGGSRSGTAMMSLFQQMAGGVMFKRTAQAMQDMGLLKEGEWSTSGGRVTINDEASKRLSGMFQKEPMSGIKALQDIMAAHGMTDPNDQMRELFRLLQRATTQRFVGEGLTNYQQMIREGAQLSNAQGVDAAAITANANSIPAAIHNLRASIDLLEETLGESHINQIVNGLNSITGAVNHLTEIARDADAMKGLSEITNLASKLQAFLVPIPAVGTMLEGAHQFLSALGQIGDYLFSLANRLRSLIGLSPITNSGLPGITTGDIHKLYGQKTPAMLDSDPVTGLPYPQKQNYVPGGTGFGNLLHNASYSPDFNIHGAGNFAAPSSSQKFIVIHTALNIDGATLAREVEGQIAELHELPDAASSGNGVAFNTINDWNPGIG